MQVTKIKKLNAKDILMVSKPKFSFPFNNHIVCTLIHSWEI
jgi:hypothetical protein